MILPKTDKSTNYEKPNANENSNFLSCYTWVYYFNYYSTLKTQIMILIETRKNISFFKYDKLANKAIANFKSIGTVKIFKGFVFVQKVSFPFFLDLLMREAKQIKIITQL